METFKFCPYCGIGLSNAENLIHYCQNCKTDFSEPSLRLQLKEYEEADDLWDDEEEESIEEYNERINEENCEIAENCKCGAWVINKQGKAVHVADCYCGAE